MSAEKPDDCSPEIAEQAIPGGPPNAENASRHGPTPTAAARRAAVEETAGALTGVFARDELARLRDDWPA